MTAPVANCPSCGGPVRFRWSQAVQTVCEYCSSILVRHDVDLEAVGKVSAPPPVTSRVRVGTGGRYRDRPFTVVGRIAYAYERGGWSEWHVVFGDGASGWLSDAQAEYAVTFLSPHPGSTPLPPSDAVKVGDRFQWAGGTYEAATLTRARYAGVEGELPFEYWDHDEVLFVDLRSPEGRLATLDYSDPRPLLFLGEHVPLADLRLTGLRDPEERRAGEVRTLNCSNCGGPVEIRAPEQTVNVACRHCGSILDARSPGVKVLQRVKKAQKVEPRIPLGSRGHLRGAEYQVLGFQVRAIRVEGTAYSWREYLLFNPEHGFRYLTEYDGHWNDVALLKSAPRVFQSGGRPAAELHGQVFKHFQTATAETTYVLGEFPWEVRVGDQVTVADYVAPPRMLSSETTGDEKTWSLGEYVTGTRIWEAFKLPGKPPPARGTYANQPSPHAPVARRAWKAFALLFALWMALAIGRMVLAPSQHVLTTSYAFDPFKADSSVLVTEPFTLEGRPSNVEVELDTDLSNAWAYFNFSLLNLDTRTAIDFGREVSYYYGVDQGESWSEGDRDDRAVVPTVPAGRYVLRVAPEGPSSVQYSLRVRRDVPNPLFYFVALLLLIVPPLFLSLRAGSFETARWAESDYAPDEDDD